MSADHSDETSSVSSDARSDDPRIEKNDKEIWDEHFADVLGEIEKTQAASTPGPAKLQFDDGIYFIKHVPKWSDPKWEDHPNVMIKEAGTRRSFRRRDATFLRRPPLLARDREEEPTTYALRYGIHQDAPSRGRSQMSPDNSDTRTLLYKDKNGAWTTIGLEEARRFESFAPNEGEPLQPLFTALETVKEDEPNYEQAQALKRWWQMWLDDRDWQKVINHGMTTTEMCNAGLESNDIAHTVPQSTLNGVIHPLLDRSKWIVTYKVSGDDEAHAKPMFTMFDCCEEWSAVRISLV